MKKRKIYWRRKGKKIICEGKIKNKTVYLFQLPSPKEFLRRVIDGNLGDGKYTKKKSFWNKEKTEKIKTIFLSLDYKDEKRNI